MIHYLVTARHHYAMSEYLESWGQSIARAVQVVPYSKLAGQADLPRGCYVFSDLERLDALQRTLLAAVWARLEAAGEGVRLLNHPLRGLGRHSLLQSLSDSGQNQFRAFRADAAGEPWRYPVFIREASEHTGNRSPLLVDSQQVHAVLLKMVLAGFSLQQLLVVEFCETADEAGIYRKYAAFRIGDRILPRHVLFSRNWVLKDLDLLDDDMKAEIHAYCRDNPHEAQIRDVFEQAHIDYGRIDYAMKDGHMQVWEINTNPVVMRAPQHYAPASLPFHERFAEAFRAAFGDIDTRSSPWPTIAMNWAELPLSAAPEAG